MTFPPSGDQRGESASALVEVIFDTLAELKNKSEV